MIIVKQNADTVDGEHAADIVTTSRVNTVGAVMESDIPDQSFINLVKNGDFESWSNGPSSSPDWWGISGTGAVARESTTKKTGTYSVKFTATGNSYLNKALPNYLYYRGRILTIGGWVWCDTPGVASLSIYDGVTYKVAHSGSSSWEWLSLTRTIAAGASSIYPQMNVAAGNVAYFDGIIFVQGSVCPAFSPMPLVDDGIMLQSNTPSAANDYGKTGQWCYDADYIYICTATDTWKRVAISTW